MCAQANADQTPTQNENPVGRSERAPQAEDKGERRSRKEAESSPLPVTDNAARVRAEHHPNEYSLRWAHVPAETRCASRAPRTEVMWLSSAGVVLNWHLTDGQTKDRIIICNLVQIAAILW